MNSIREIKFKFVLEDVENNTFLTKVFTIEQLTNGEFVNWFKEQSIPTLIVHRFQYMGKKDILGREIYEEDEVLIYNWGKNTSNNILGKGKVYFNMNEGCWQTFPCIIEDQYDFQTKARFLKLVASYEL